MTKTIVLGEKALKPDEVWSAARQISGALGPMAKIVISDEARNKVAASADVIRAASESGAPVYGVNTGVGALKNIVIEKSKIAQLQLNLLRSHACGVGEPLPRSMVAAMWIIFLNSVAHGHKGISLPVVDRIIDLLNAGVLAQVPSKGSVGASGDLAPSAHAALVLIGEGICTVPVNGEIRSMPAGEALSHLKMAPIELRAKEGLSLMNGTQLTSAYACRAWSEAANLWETATLALALSTLGFRTKPSISRLELLGMHHPATLYAGLKKQQWLEGYPLPERNHEQDPYCFRCAPQVHGAVWKEIEQCEEWITEELQATTDNPVILADTSEILHGGNFHAIYPARMLDRLTSALTQLASISERRVNLAMDSQKTGLPSFLTSEGGLNSGLMMAQTTAAALVSECKVMSFPASVDTIPTNCDQEDHVSMGPIAGWKAIHVCGNVRDVLAIEILAAYQALHLRRLPALPRRLAKVLDLLSSHITTIERDRILADDIQILSSLIEEGTLATPEDEAPYPQRISAQSRVGIVGSRIDQTNST